MADELIAFGSWMRLRRQALVLTREELAKRVGCAEVTIRKIEADERKPSPQVAELLAQHLGLRNDQHELFVRVARGIVSVAHLPPPIPGGAIPPYEGVRQEPNPHNQELTAHQPQALASLPSGTVTFLFTDIEGSTRRWEEQPGAMRLALARHDAILREVIKTYNGFVFKTVGDAFCAAFATAPDALAAAVAGQRALFLEEWGVSGPLRVRMALHTGTAEPENGDYLGQPLNRIARLLAAGHGGQLLISLATYELVRDHVPPDMTIRDLGAHRLKDLVRPESIFQVCLADLPSEFPSLKSLDTHTTNLPAQVNALIGRTQEIVTVTKLLGRSRLVTLTGPGGMGKTRLALHVASVHLDQYPDGVWFVDLSSVSDPERIASTIAQTLGIRDSADRPIVEILQSWLRARRLLLILDNCEQIIDDVSQLVAGLLRATTDLTILATSRIPLRLYAESEYAVEPLGLPTSSQLPPLEQLSQYGAVKLFITRARAVRHDFSLTNANAPAVAEICVRLDGLPLALELAAARIRLFLPEQLLSRLSTFRLQTLAGGARDLPMRQQTIRATIDWSYRLLAPEQQVLFARLGVFVGGWTFEDAEAVCGDQQVEVLGGLETLVENSLVRTQEQAGELRYTMLETIREFALERSEERGETEALRRRHAAHFVELAETMDAQIQWAGQSAWLDRLDAEYENVRAVLVWAFSGGDAELGTHLVVALDGREAAHGFWAIRGYWSEQGRWMDTAHRQSSAVAPRLSAMLSLQIATSEWGWVDEEERDALCWEALAFFRREGDLAGRAHALYRGSHRFWHRNEPDYQQSKALLEEALALYRSLNNRAGVAATTDMLGSVAFSQDDLTLAEALRGESVALFRELNVNEARLGLALHGLGEIPMLQGDMARAAALFWEAVLLIRSIGDHWMVLWPLCNLSCLALVQGDDGRVLDLLEEEVQWLREKQMNREGIVFLLHFLAALVYRQGDTRRAIALVREVLPAQLVGRDYLIKQSLDVCALIAVGLGQGPQAVRFLTTAEGLQRVYRTSWPPSWRIAHPYVIAQVRAQVDPTTFAAGWAEDRIVTLEQAVDEALAWLQDTERSMA